MKKLFIPLFIFILSLSSICASAIEIADGETLKFDFGAAKEPGYLFADADTKYSKDLGYGFHMPGSVKNAVANGEGILSDSVEFTKFGLDSKNTFNVDLPNGMYNIKIYAGDIERMSIVAEDHFIIMNLTGKNGFGEAEIPVTDGQLNILGSEGKTGTVFSISAMEITKIPENEPRKTRIFIGGDSITSTYYPLKVNQPLETGYQGGWGQMLENYLPDSFYVHNYATGGQTAIGFLTSGQFDAVENFMKPGDYFIVGFGINDQNYSNEDEFKASMIEMVQRVKKAGGTPIILTTQGRQFDFNSDDIFYKPDRWYKNTSKEIAASEKIHYIDLHDLSSAYFTNIGETDTTKLYWINWQGNLDTLHSNREGAGQMARLVAEELIRQGFEDLNGSIYGYGISPDITLKCSSVYDANKIDVQNLRPNDKKVTFVLNSYKDGKLTNCSVQTEHLPYYDVLDPHSKTTVTLNGYDENCRLFAVIDGKLIDLNNENNNFDVPYKTSIELFENYIVPEGEENAL